MKKRREEMIHPGRIPHPLSLPFPSKFRRQRLSPTICRKGARETGSGWNVDGSSHMGCSCSLGTAAMQCKGELLALAFGPGAEKRLLFFFPFPLFLLHVTSR